MSLNASAARTLREIQQIPGNEVCADCGALGETEFLLDFCADAEQNTPSQTTTNVYLLSFKLP